MSEPIFQEQILQYLAWLGMSLLLFYMAVLVTLVVSWWRIFEKADQPGWASIIPVYNFVVLNRLAQYPWWFIFLYFVPLVNFVVYVLTMHRIVKRFGHGIGFTVGIILLFIIFTPILAFGKSEYKPEFTGY